MLNTESINLLDKMCPHTPKMVKNIQEQCYHTV